MYKMYLSRLIYESKDCVMEFDNQYGHFHLNWSIKLQEMWEAEFIISKVILW